MSTSWAVFEAERAESAAESAAIRAKRDEILAQREASRAAAIELCARKKEICDRFLQAIKDVGAMDFIAAIHPIPDS